MNVARRFLAIATTAVTLGVLGFAGTAGATPTASWCTQHPDLCAPEHTYHHQTFWESHWLGIVIGVGCLVIWGAWKLSGGDKRTESEAEPHEPAAEPVYDYPTPTPPVHDYPSTPTPTPTPPVHDYPSTPTPTPTPPVHDSPSTPPDEDW